MERERERVKSQEQGRCEQQIMTEDREIKTSSCEENNLRCGPENKTTCPRQEFVTRDLCGTQLPMLMVLLVARLAK